ncbi:MAG: class I SAM-dependent methyltransferase [Hyphomicrobiales bacterium]|nr:class I SAM-dependent methyltransferase [Hyphomicrobiales bacterium]MCP5370696.1 class I SAM-dependent methyltransferase [Hyphomicrobiales bacterium]
MSQASDQRPPRHLRIATPSPWVARFAPLVPAGGPVLDLACGGGRHARLFLDRGHAVTAVDRDTAAVADLAGDNSRARVITADLEDGTPPFGPGGALAGTRFAGIIVCNYLYRPLNDALVAALAPGGVLIYETFARGNEAFTRPRNPDHLLRAGELLDLVRGRLQVVAYEHGVVEKSPCPGVIQRICAVNDLDASDREDREPAPHPVVPPEY